MVVVPKEGFKRPEVNPENEECHCSHCEVERDREKNKADEGTGIQEEFITQEPVPEVPKKRPSRSKKAKEETAETVTE
jgi:hypothetical protein